MKGRFSAAVKHGPAAGLFFALLFPGALFWASANDPFDRHWFQIAPDKTPSVRCVAVLPKTAPRPLPVVIFLHGSGGSLINSGNDLRQIAEMGLAAVGMDYCQTNKAVFERQFTGLIDYLGRQPWADTNRVGWLGYSLGAQQSLSYLLEHPERAPAMLARLGGGVVPEMAEANTNRYPALRVLLMHGEHEEVFPMDQMRQTADFLKARGATVEIRILPGLGHSLEGHRGAVFRRLGEQCLTTLKGKDALAQYRSSLAWRRASAPLWVYLIPAALWAGGWLSVTPAGSRLYRRLVAGRPSRRGVRSSPGALSLRNKSEPEPKNRSGDPRRVRSSLRYPDPFPQLGVACQPHIENRRCKPLVAAAWCVAGLLAFAAIGNLAAHWLLPRLPVSERSLAAARSTLVPARERADFDELARNPAWRGRRLGPLMEHAHLANYNRSLVNWELPDAIYNEYVLNPFITTEADDETDWRRVLWEGLYPRIRRETSPEAAAQIVATCLSERITIWPGVAEPMQIRDSWDRQITSENGFRALYVAALRSCGIPARFNLSGAPEIWCDSIWKPAPARDALSVHR